MHITILGGGPAGLAVGYYSSKRGKPFTIYEAAARTGGNAVTVRCGDFYFDSGAHRLHGEDEAITEEFKEILGEDLRQIDLPSMIYDDGELIEFPLTPYSLLKHLGFRTFFKAGMEVLLSRADPQKSDRSFQSYVVRAYGNTIASRFLLNYSAKLWGLPCDRLSPSVSGKRLKGLDLKAFVSQAVLGRNYKGDHVEGRFYYPVHGIGEIMQNLTSLCGDENIIKNSAITKIRHDNIRILEIQINHEKWIQTNEVVNTLPINQFLHIMDPLPPEEVLSVAKGLCFRNVRLVAFFIDQETIAKAATLYFPDLEYPFTRLYEPKNRCPQMAPEGKTSLVAEIPCQCDDDLWKMDEKKILELIKPHILKTGLISEKDIIGTAVEGIENAYPVLEIDSEEKMATIRSYLDKFENLKHSGRNGMFAYLWIHNVMQFGNEIVAEYE